MELKQTNQQKQKKNPLGTCVPECDDSSCRINVERGAIYGICLRGTDIRISDVKRWVPDCSSRL